jgi:hypothetical protein
MKKEKSGTLSPRVIQTVLFDVIMCQIAFYCCHARIGAQHPMDTIDDTVHGTCIEKVDPCVFITPKGSRAGRFLMHACFSFACLPSHHRSFDLSFIDR